MLGMGILWLGSAVAFSLAAQVSANENPTLDTRPVMKQMKEITAEEKAEMLTKHQEILAQQLENGRISQEQFDEMNTKIANGEFFTMRGNLRWGEKLFEKGERGLLVENIAFKSQ